MEDAIAAHQRPKLEVYDDDLFVVLKTARYDDRSETVEFAELQLFVGASYVVTVRHGEASALADVRRTIEADLERIRCGPMAVLHAVIDHVVDDYVPVIDGLDNDMAEIEDAVFATDRPRGVRPQPADLQAQARGARLLPQHRAAPRAARPPGGRAAARRPPRARRATSATSRTTSSGW